MSDFVIEAAFEAFFDNDWNTARMGEKNAERTEFLMARARTAALISIAESLAKLVEAQDIEFERMELMKLGADIG